MLAKTKGYHGTAIWSCTPERQKSFLFSQPILPFRYVFYYRSADSFDWQNIADLKGKTIGLTQDYAYGNALKKAARKGIVKTDMTTSDESNFRKLVVGRIDLFPIDPVVGEYIIKNELPPELGKEITFDPTPLRNAAYYILFNEKNPDSKKLKTLFDAGLAMLKKSGRLEQIAAEYVDYPTGGTKKASNGLQAASCIVTIP